MDGFGQVSAVTMTGCVVFLAKGISQAFSETTRPVTAQLHHGFTYNTKEL
jgi:hypothetical protein